MNYQNKMKIMTLPNQWDLPTLVYDFFALYDFFNLKLPIITDTGLSGIKRDCLDLI